MEEPNAAGRPGRAVAGPRARAGCVADAQRQERVQEPLRLSAQAREQRLRRARGQTAPLPHFWRRRPRGGSRASSSPPTAAAWTTARAKENRGLQDLDSSIDAFAQLGLSTNTGALRRPLLLRLQADHDRPRPARDARRACRRRGALIDEDAIEHELGTTAASSGGSCRATRRWPRSARASPASRRRRPTSSTARSARSARTCATWTTAPSARRRQPRRLPPAPAGQRHALHLAPRERPPEDLQGGHRAQPLRLALRDAPARCSSTRSRRSSRASPRTSRRS